MAKKPATIEEYLAAMPDDRREALEAVRKVILKKLPKGYEETFNWGMITYQVPLSTFPDTYNKQPLMYAALANNKREMAVHLMCTYGDEQTRAKFEEDYRATGKRFDAGKSCVRFRKLDDLPLPLIGKTIASVSVKKLIEWHEATHSKAAKAARRRAR